MHIILFAHLLLGPRVSPNKRAMALKISAKQWLKEFDSRSNATVASGEAVREAVGPHPERIGGRVRNATVATGALAGETDNGFGG